MLSYMGILLRRLASILFAASGWLIAGIRTTLDLIGWSTAPDDVGVAMSRLDEFFSWLLSIPWWGPWGFALITTLWLMWVSWPRIQLAGSFDAVPIMTTPEPLVPEVTIEQQARDDLEIFVTNHLLRTCDALVHLQSELIRRAGLAEPIYTIATDGLLGRWDLRDFDSGLHALSGFGDSPPSVPNAEELVGGVDQIEKGYPILCKQGQDIAVAVGATFGQDARLDAVYEEWRKSHNATVDAYENIKGDPRMKRDEILRKLHRPVRQTRFGSYIPQPKANDSLPIYMAS